MASKWSIRTGCCRTLALDCGVATGGHVMKTYEGERTLAGAIVTVDGQPLPPRYDLQTFSRTGFEWTYRGPGPQQLALALLADHTGNDAQALALSDPFMNAVVAHLDNAWVLTSAEIDAVLRELDQASPDH
jgi:hypothetical protein